MKETVKVVARATRKTSSKATTRKATTKKVTPKTTKVASKKTLNSKKVTAQKVTTKKVAPKTTEKVVKKKAVAQKTNKSYWDAVKRKIAQKLQQKPKLAPSLGRSYEDKQHNDVEIILNVVVETISKFEERINKRIDKFETKFEKEIKKVRKEIGGITNQLGKESEQYFYDLLKQDPQFKRMFPFRDIAPNVKNNDKTDENGKVDKTRKFEFDMIVEGINPRRILIIEVKRRFETKDLQSFMKKPIHLFIKENPKYKNMKIHLGIAAYSYEKNAMENAKKKGVFVFKNSPFNPYHFPETPKNFNGKK